MATTKKTTTEKKNAKVLDLTNVAEQIREIKKTIMVKRMEMLAGKVKDLHEVAKLRDKIARLKTAQRAKELNKV